MLKRCSLVFVFLLALPTGLLAADGNYVDNVQARAMIDDLVANEGFDRARLEAIFTSARRQQSIIDAMTRPAEKTKPWHEYRKIFLTEQRADEGREFMAAHRDTLARAEAETGVPAEVIVAIIGVETYYGRITGKHRVIDALSTLAFDYPPRSPFFTSELKHYLLLTREQGVDPLSFKGSYAGAMGYGQFMPSSYRAYAVDFDGDGKTDIWNNPVDAIGSVANYFKRHGWRAGEPVVSPAKLIDDVPGSWFNDGLKPKRIVAEYIAAGILPEQEIEPAADAAAMKFEGETGDEYWIGLHNFYVITRYNHSSMYALSVYQLSQQLKG